MDLWERGYAKSLIIMFKRPGLYVGLKNKHYTYLIDWQLNVIGYFPIQNVPTLDCQCVY
jgi:hypothetical protein